MSLRSYSVWHDHQEQWDPLCIDEPALRCEAASFVAAAERLADESDSSYGDFIVRDEASGQYRQISLRRSWTVTRDCSTTVQYLSEM